MKKLLLYLMVLTYVGAGAMHFIKPDFYLLIMPVWLPIKMILIYVSGILEMALGIFLIPPQTRKIAVQLIVAMLIVFLILIHIPQSIDFYKTANKYFIVSLIRIPIQFLLIAWAYKIIPKGNRL